MLEQTSERCVEGLVAGPEAREGQDALTAELLDKTTLGEDDGEDVAKGGKGNEDGEGALGGATKNVAEQGSGDEAARGQDLLLGNGSEVGNVDEHVKNRDGTDGDGSSKLQGADRVLRLAEGVVGVAVTDVGPDDVVDGGDDTVGTAGGALKGIVEVVEVIVDLEVTAEGNEASDDHEEDNGELDPAEKVLQAQTPLEGGTVDDEGRGDASETDTTLVEAGDLNVGGVQDVLAKDDRVTGGPTEEDDVAGVETGGQELGLAVDVLEVVLLTTVLGNGGAELHVDGGTSKGDDHTGDPHEEGQTDGTRGAQNAGRRGEDTSTNDAVEDEETGADDANLALSLALLLNAAYTVILSARKAQAIQACGGAPYIRTDFAVIVRGGRQEAVLIVGARGGGRGVAEDAGRKVVSHGVWMLMIVAGLWGVCDQDLIGDRRDSMAAGGSRNMQVRRARKKGRVREGVL